MGNAYLERLSQWWIPSVQTDDPERRFRAEVGFALAGLLLVAMLLLGLAELFWGTLAFGIIYMVAVLAMAAIMQWQRYDAAATHANAAMLGLAFLAATTINLGSGGGAIGTNIAMPSFVLLAAMLSPPRLALLWLLLVLGQLLLVAHLRDLDLAFPFKPDPKWVENAIDRVPMVLSLTCAWLGWLVRRALLGFRARLEAAYESEHQAHARASQLAEQFAGFADIAADGFWETDAELRLSYVSPGFARMFAVEPEHLLGRTHDEAFRTRFPGAPLDPEYSRAMREQRVLSGQLWKLLDSHKADGKPPDDHEHRHEHGHEQARWLITQGKPRYTEDGCFNGYRGVVQEVTAQEIAKHEMRASEERLRLITDNLPALISYIDADGIFRFNNRAYEIWLDRPLSAVINRSLAEVFEPDIYALIEPNLRRALAGERVEFDLTLGANRGRHAHVNYVPDIGPDGEVRGVCGLSHDVTQVRHVENELRRLAEFDLLTGLANRKRLGDKLCEAIARSERYGQPMALLFIDMDEFKAVNDRLGHEGGDLVLQEFARRLLACVRQTDTVARLAGDEFVVLLEMLHNADEARLVATKIVVAMTAEFPILGQRIALSASIGVAGRAAGELDGESLLRRADSALYAAKAAGRGTFRLAAS
ncbi:MAG: diguanylate cyclase domain-containing protein [Pseudomarimonas sp.]